MVITDLPLNDRPRERMARQGAGALADTELLAILIGPGRPGKSSIDLAREVLSDGLRGLARTEWIPDKAVGNLRGTPVARIGAALELGRRIGCLAGGEGETIRDPASLGSALATRYSHHVQERVGAIYFDSRNRIIREREIYIGTLTSATISTRDILRFALEDSAASTVVFHNHPSGDPSPSAEDLQFTKTLLAAGKVMGIEILDHLILGSNRYVSLKQQGLM